MGSAPKGHTAVPSLVLCTFAPITTPTGCGQPPPPSHCILPSWGLCPSCLQSPFSGAILIGLLLPQRRLWRWKPVVFKFLHSSGSLTHETELGSISFSLVLPVSPTCWLRGGQGSPSSTSGHLCNYAQKTWLAQWGRDACSASVLWFSGHSTLALWFI